MGDQNGPWRVAQRLPTGTVTFLVAELVTPQEAWQAEPDAMRVATKQFEELLEGAVGDHGGIRPPEVAGIGVVAAFSLASDAVLAAQDAQRCLLASQWPTSTPVRARIAVATEKTDLDPDGNYATPAIVRARHLRDVGHGGQVLVSAATRDLAADRLGDRVALVDLGPHRLRDLSPSQRIFQLSDPSLPGDFPPLRSLDTHPNNLPAELTSFIGRGEELARVAKLLGDNRLVTIGGVGGAGKTRLAQHVGAQLIDHYPDGVWWVELADRRDMESLAAAVASAIGMQARQAEGSEAALADRLADRQSLVILDNCEHVIEAAVRLAAELLRRAPGVDILATSREPLAIPGEVIWQIPQLQVPLDTARPMHASELAPFEAVQLFVDRAERVRSNFQLNDDNAPAVADICRRLDGIPLALELAASRCRSMTPAQILSGLTESLGVLASGARGGPPRHQTLAASMRWSYDLLSAEEQVLLRRLAVFNGGCTLTDAEEVVVDDLLPVGAVLDALDGLVAQSLVHLDDTHPDGRYRLLETVRQFGVELLTDRGEYQRFTERHADHFLALCTAVGPRLNDDGALAAFARLAPELNNVRGALLTFEGAHRWAACVALVYDTALAWHVLAPTEASGYLTKALEHADALDPVTRARAWVARSIMRTNTGEYEGALADAQAAVSQVDDPVASARASMALAVAVPHFDVAAGDVALQEAAAAMGPEANPLDAAAVRWGQVFYQICWGDARLGFSRVDQFMPYVERLNNPLGTAFAVASLAWGLCLQGQYTRAFELIQQADDEFAAVASAAGVDVTLLIRAWSGGVLLEVARALACEATGPTPERLDRVNSLGRDGRAEGSIIMHVLLGTIAARHLHMTGESERASSGFDEVIEAASSVGATYFASIAMASAAERARQDGDAERAAEFITRLEGIGPGYRAPYSWIRASYTKARLTAANGALATAEETVREGLSAANDSGYLPEVAQALGLLSRLAADQERFIEAARLAGAAQRLRDDIGLVCDFERVQADVEAGLVAARQETSDDAVQHAYDEGYALELEAAVAYARRARGERRRPRFGWDSITPTEHQVIAEVVAGKSNPEIANCLFMSRETVKTHLSSIFGKLAVTSRAQLAASAARRDEPD